jgi:hypothetical protein
VFSLYRPAVTTRTTNFGIEKVYILSTLSIFESCMDLITDSDYFLTQHYATDFIVEIECVYCAVRTESSNKIQISLGL